MDVKIKILNNIYMYNIYPEELIHSDVGGQ